MSTIVKAAGTNTSDSTVETNKPPITAIAIGARNPPPSPRPSAAGAMPAAIAIVVMMIGRARLWPASTSACRRGVPRPISSMAKSTSMIAFLVTMPISIRMPRITGIDTGVPVISSAAIEPPIDSGSDARMVIGARNERNSRTSRP